MNRDPGRPGEARHGGDEVVALFQRHPKVLAWINGHSHQNEITPRGHLPGRSPPPRMWTSPSVARVFERSWNNHDGTISLFTTLNRVGRAATARTSRTCPRPGSRRSTAKAVLQPRPAPARSWPVDVTDRNTELLLRKP
ncbi:hypothetical protein SBADM41S_02901 [Streptomyces badius]